MDHGRPSPEEPEARQDGFAEGLHLPRRFRYRGLALPEPAVMSGVFQPSFVIAEDNTVVALRFIESMNLTRTDEEQVVDRLKGDSIIDIRTISGNSYVISSIKQMEIIGKQYKLPSDPGEVRTAIFERWLNLTGNN